MQVIGKNLAFVILYSKATQNYGIPGLFRCLIFLTKDGVALL